MLLGKDQIRACVTPVVGAASLPITTLEGLPALYSQSHGKRPVAAAPGQADHTALHPLQQAWIDEQVPQCGYCQNGMLIQAADLLMKNSSPTDGQIREAMNGHLCRCGTYSAIIRAIKRASAVMA